MSMNMVNPPVGMHGDNDLDGRVAYLTADATLRVGQSIVRGTANTANDSWTLTLPPVAQAIGLSIYIEATIANSKTITVQDNNDDAGLTDITLDADGEYVMLFSTGEAWIELVTGYS